MENFHSCKIIELYKSLGVNVFEQCDIGHNDRQYAAVDAYIDNLELPLITSRSFCNVQSTPKFCIKSNEALKLSVLAIIGTYAKMNNLIFFTPDDDNMSTFLQNILEIRSDKYPGTVISISVNKANKRFRVTSYDTKICQDLSEGDMITVISPLADADRSMTFHLNPDSLVYATYMHSNINSMWIAKLSNSIQTIGAYGSEIMPVLYDTPHKSNILRLNIGRGQMEAQELNLIQCQINATNLSIMSATSKDKLCYCCAYMKKIHSVLCCHEMNIDTSFEAKLLTDFINQSD